MAAAESQTINMNKPEFSLMALEPIPGGRGWKKKVIPILKNHGLEVVSSGQGVFVVKEILSTEDFDYCDGLLINRIWLGPGRNGLSIQSLRQYFIKGTNQIIKKPEREILIGKPKPSSGDSEDKLRYQRELLETLITNLKPTPSMVKLESLFQTNTGLRNITINGTTVDTTLNALKTTYKKLGFEYVPADMTITLCALDGCGQSSGYGQSSIEDFKRGIKKTGFDFGVTRVTVRTASYETVLKQLNSFPINQGAQNIREGRCVLFLLKDRKTKISVATKEIFMLADSVGVPFRRAYTTDRIKYSIPDQFQSLLMAAGGQPHKANSNVRQNRLWTLGVDLSHRRYQNRSILAVTLVNPDGLLKAAWAAVSQRLDETVNAQDLNNILNECKIWLDDSGFKGEIVVLRDGRMFENENHEIYTEALGLNLSFLELKKRPNIQVFNRHGQELKIHTPWAGTVREINTTMFISTTPENSDENLQKFIRVNWLERQNHLNLKAEEIARVIIASSAAPGLGLHLKHTPAAIYWSDGIAGRSNTDLRFRGIPVTIV